MINKIDLVLYSLVLLLMSACECTEEYCSDINDFKLVFFYDFSLEEIDSVTIYMYEHNSNFTDPIDSSFSFRSINTVRFLDLKIDITKAYKLILNSTGETFTLSNFEISVKGCGQCGLLGRRDREKIIDLASYEINGQRRKGAVIEIYN